MHREAAVTRPTGRALAILVTTLATASAGQAPFVLDSNALGPMKLCARLASVGRVFPQARDTVIRAEGNTRWPAKIVSLDSTTWVFVESSWADTTHVWRISTNSPRFRTRRGYRVGMKLGELISKGEHFTAEIAEGQLGLLIVSERIGLGIDDQAAAAFPYNWPAGADATKRVDPNARITYLAAGGDCRH